MAILLLAVVPSQAQGQSVHGRVWVSQDTAGVDGADLSLLDSAGVFLLRVQSDSIGFFRLPAPEAGSYRIRATRIGFAEIIVPIELGEKEIVEVELRMAEEAIPLRPLIVTARREIEWGTLDVFYDRMARNRERGVGWFFTRADIERRVDTQVPFFLHSVPGVFLSANAKYVQMRHRGEFCSPRIFVDGFERGAGDIQMMDLEGIEVYRGRFEQISGHFPNDCGTIFYWRRTDWGHPFTWRRAYAAGGLLGVLFAIAAIF